MKSTMTGCCLVLLGACVNVTTTHIGPSYEPLPPEAEIAVFSQKTPQCEFEELAVATAQRDPVVDADRALQALKKEARRVGGHALLGVEAIPAGEDVMPGLSATIIRFVDADCRRE